MNQGDLMDFAALAAALYDEDIADYAAILELNALANDDD